MLKEFNSQDFFAKMLKLNLQTGSKIALKIKQLDDPVKAASS